MPRTSRSTCRLQPSAPPDVMQATIAQLTRLLAKILQLHLSSRHLVSIGTKASMAHCLYNSIHQVVPQYMAVTSMPATTMWLHLSHPAPSSTPLYCHHCPISPLHCHYYPHHLYPSWMSTQSNTIFWLLIGPILDCNSEMWHMYLYNEETMA